MPLDFSRIELTDELMISVYKEKTPSQRLKIAFGLWKLARTLLFNSLKSINPDWTDQQIQKEVARRLSHGAV